MQKMSGKTARVDKLRASIEWEQSMKEIENAILRVTGVVLSGDNLEQLKASIEWVDTSNFTGVLGSGDDTVQAALETLDQAAGVSYPLLAPDGSIGVPSYSFASDTYTGFILNDTGQLSAVAAGLTATVFTDAFNYHLYPQRHQGGSAAAPVVTFATDTNTGVYSAAADTLGFSAGGVERLNIGKHGARFSEHVVAEAFYVESGGELGPVGLKVPDGSLSDPSMTFASDTDTGFRLNATGQLAASAAGLTATVFTDAFNYHLYPQRHPGGSAAAPVVTFTSDTDTGVYSAAADTLGFSAGGTHRMTVGRDGVSVEDKITAEAFYLQSGGEVPQSYVENFSAAGEWVVTHNLNRNSFMAQAYNGVGVLLTPNTVHVNDKNVTYFYFAEAQDGKAVIFGVN